MTILRVQTVFTGVAGSPFYNSLYFNALNDPQQCVDAVAAFWSDIAEIQRTPLSGSTGSEVLQIDETTGNATGSVGVVGASWTATDVDEPLPPATQALIRAKTGLYQSGRRLQGRIFVPGLTELSNESGQISDSAGTVIGGAAVALVNDPDVDWLIWSRTTGAISPVEVVDLWAEFAVLRSRRD